MIDGLLKKHIDPLWEAASTPLVRARLTPNQVTAAGLVLVCLSALAYLWHRSDMAFGLCLSLAFTFDALDGAVARRRGLSSRRGGYFDAMVDRYQELVVLAALAWVHDAWAMGMAAASGSFLISYAKARVALEMPVSNDNWPDLFERMERVIFICLMLVLSGIFGGWITVWGLGLFALLAHGTALQRAGRAAKMLAFQDQKDQVADREK